mmetsp:Transcript_12915/g.32953  ORF Transcript_12915/g.32953 Transcript_12915/m.32953 type:complete len:96 (+) Transcript_12915:254-541(+)
MPCACVRACVCVCVCVLQPPPPHCAARCLPLPLPLPLMLLLRLLRLLWWRPRLLLLPYQARQVGQVVGVLRPVALEMFKDSAALHVGQQGKRPNG